MTTYLVLGSSVALQFVAAALALWLIRVTGKRLAWTLVALSIVLMALRRTISLWHLSAGTGQPDLAAELVALFISAIMTSGLALIIPLFKSIRNSEEALRESEEHFRGLAEAAFDGVVVHDGTRIAAANSAFAEMFGYAEHEVVGMSIADFILADTQKFRLEDVRAGREEPYEVNAVRKDGKFLRLEVCGKQTTHRGSRARVIAVRNITERKEQERRMRFLSTAIEQSTEGIAMSDQRGHLVFVNHAFARMHGFQPEQLTGKHLSIFHTPEQMAAVKEANRVIRETGAFHGEVWHARRNGEVFPAEMHNSVVTDAKGRPAGMLATARDITDKKKAETELRESEERWRSLVENAPAFILTLERDGTISWINRTLEGYSPESVGGSSVFDYIPSDYVPSMRDALRRVFETGEPVAFENKGPGPGGTVSWYSNSLAAIIHGGKPTAATLISIDITARKHAEDALRRAHDELERRIEERTAELKAANERLRHEISERERIEVALRESEAQYRHLFQNAQVGIYRATADGSRMLAANEKLAGIYGCTVDELLSKPVRRDRKGGTEGEQRKGVASREWWPDAATRNEVLRRLSEDGAITDHEVPS